MSSFFKCRLNSTLFLFLCNAPDDEDMKLMIFDRIITSEREGPDRMDQRERE